MEKDREYYESLDKRTREYKEWKESQEQSKQSDEHLKNLIGSKSVETMGLGDAVEKVAKATGIKTAVEHLFGEDCGCNERKEKLNDFGRRLRDIFRSPKIDFLTKDEYIYLGEFKNRYNGRELKKEDQVKLLEIHNRVFKTKKELSSCASCLKDLCNKMINLYNQYK